jgi:chromosome segregation ATPase
MPVSLHKIFGHDAATEQLPAELRTVLSQMRQERAAFEALHTRAQQSAQQLNELVGPVTETQRTVGELQSRVKSLERLVPVLATLDEQTEGVAKSQRRIETQLAQGAEEAQRLRVDTDELRENLEQALTLKRELAGFLELGDAFQVVRGEAGRATTQLHEIAQGFEQIRNYQEEIRKANDAAATRLATFEDRQREVQGSVATMDARVAAMDRTLEHLSQAADDAGQVKRQLGTLKSLADHVTQKVSALEQQRGVVDRATSQVAHLQDLLSEVATRTQALEQAARDFGGIEAKLDALRASHAELLAQGDQIRTRQDDARQADEGLQVRLATLQDDVARAVKRFELETQGMEAVRKRIADLRGGLTDMESRFQSLEQSSREIADIGAQVDGLGTRLEAVADVVAQVEPQVERLGGTEAKVTRVEETIDTLSQRTGRLEKLQPVIEAALQDAAELRGTHESVTVALERLREGAAEIASVREQHSVTQAWLTDVTGAVTAVRAEIAAIEEFQPSVAAARTEVEQVRQSVSQIEARRQLVEELNARLSQLAAQGGQLEERTHGLLVRMDAADERFLSVSAHAKAAEQVERIVPSALATIEQAERRVVDVEGSVSALEGRTRGLEDLARRTEALGGELARHQQALEKASVQLEGAATLREEAATASAQLEERANQLTAAVGSAARRLTEVTGVLDDLESRSRGLRIAQKRMAQFEERLAKWHASEAHLTQALEHISQRQATLDTLRTEMQRLFELAERTVEDVRSVAAARENLAETRATLETVMDLVGHAHDAANSLDHRQRQVEQAEARLGRAEGLLADIHSSLETLHGQQALMDQVIEKAGALEFYTRQAESVIESLRSERGLSDRFHSAVTELREEEAVTRSA